MFVPPPWITLKRRLGRLTGCGGSAQWLESFSRMLCAAGRVRLSAMSCYLDSPTLPEAGCGEEKMLAALGWWLSGRGL